ncbi:hypothetical protein OKW48_005803 [Paraburkholderia youngii]
MTVSSTSDTISRNATPSTSPNEISRTRTSASQLAVRGPLYGHTILSALFSDENVADAPIASSEKEMIVAMPPLAPAWCAFSTIVCTPAAAWSPIRPLMWPNSSPRAAAGPKNQPATAITITSVGASENAA